MSMLAKAAGAVFGTIGAVYGTFALYTVISANGEVSQFSEQEKRAKSNLVAWQSSLQKQEQDAITAETESKAQETVCHPASFPQARTAVFVGKSQPWNGASPASEDHSTTVGCTVCECCRTCCRASSCPVSNTF